MKICVLCRIDRSGNPSPRVFHLGKRRHPVVTILDRWTEPPHRYFEVRVEDGRRFVLCHDPATGAWELAAALSRPRPGTPQEPEARTLSSLLLGIFGRRTAVRREGAL